MEKYEQTKRFLKSNYGVSINDDGISSLLDALKFDINPPVRKTCKYIFGLQEFFTPSNSRDEKNSFFVLSYVSSRYDDICDIGYYISMDRSDNYLTVIKKCKERLNQIIQSKNKLDFRKINESNSVILYFGSVFLEESNYEKRLEGYMNSVGLVSSINSSDLSV